MGPKEEIFKKLTNSVLEGDSDNALAIAKEVIENGIDPIEAINQGLTPGIKEVGDLFGKGEYFLPQVILAAEAMNAAIDYLKKYIPREKTIKPLGIVVIGTVAGDIHDIGSKFVATMLEANGFKVYHIGADVSAEKFIEEAEKVGANIIGASALITTTMTEQKILIKTLEKKSLKSKYKVIIGGAPVNERWTREIKADGYAADALSAVELAKTLLNR